MAFCLYMRVYIYNPVHWESDTLASVLFKDLLHSFSSDVLISLRLTHQPTEALYTD